MKTRSGNPYTRSRVLTSLAVVFFAWFLGMLACSTPASSLSDQKAYTDDQIEYRRKFEVQFDEEEKPLRYGYYYVVSRLAEAYRVRVFHPDKKVMTEEKTFSTPALTLLHGPYSGYWDDGSIRSRGTYQYGRKHGNWLECEPGKGKSATGPYINDKKEGIWTQLDTNGLVESVYTWHDGMRHGKFFTYDSLGHKTNEGLYRSDTLVAELFKKPTVQRPYIKTCESPYFGDKFTCTDMTLLQKVYDQLKYPSEARQHGIEGSAVMQWDVLADGSVSRLRVPQGLSDEIEAECMRVLKDMPEWVPAKKEGIAVRYTMSLTLNFTL